MVTLQELLKLDGVVAAGEFTAEGDVVDFEANMEMLEELAGMTAQFCATITMVFNTVAGAFTQLSGMDWTPTRLDVRRWRLHGCDRRQHWRVRRNPEGRFQRTLRGPHRQPVNPLLSTTPSNESPIDSAWFTSQPYRWVRFSGSDRYVLSIQHPHLSTCGNEPPVRRDRLL